MTADHQCGILVDDDDDCWWVWNIVVATILGYLVLDHRLLQVLLLLFLWSSDSEADLYVEQKQHWVVVMMTMIVTSCEHCCWCYC
jgi:hypothetical protein